MSLSVERAGGEKEMGGGVQEGAIRPGKLTPWASLPQVLWVQQVSV